MHKNMLNKRGPEIDPLWYPKQNVLPRDEL